MMGCCLVKWETRHSLPPPRLLIEELLAMSSCPAIPGEATSREHCTWAWKEGDGRENKVREDYKLCSPL